MHVIGTFSTASQSGVLQSLQENSIKLHTPRAQAIASWLQATKTLQLTSIQNTTIWHGTWTRATGENPPIPHPESKQMDCQKLHAPACGSNLRVRDKLFIALCCRQWSVGNQAEFNKLVYFCLGIWSCSIPRLSLFHVCRSKFDVAKEMALFVNLLHLWNLWRWSFKFSQYMKTYKFPPQSSLAKQLQM